MTTELPEDHGDQNAAEPLALRLSEGLGPVSEAWEQMRAAVLDALIVGHIYRTEHETNPRMAVADLLAWETQTAISKELHRVADRLDELARHRHSTARTCEASQALQYKTSADTLRIVADELRA